MYLLPTVSALNVGTLAIPLSDTTLVRGNTSRVITFPTTPVALAAGTYPASLDYRLSGKSGPVYRSESADY